MQVTDYQENNETEKSHINSALTVWQSKLEFGQSSQTQFTTHLRWG